MKAAALGHRFGAEQRVLVPHAEFLAGPLFQLGLGLPGSVRGQPLALPGLAQERGQAAAPGGLSSVPWAGGTQRAPEEEKLSPVG